MLSKQIKKHITVQAVWTSEEGKSPSFIPTFDSRATSLPGFQARQIKVLIFPAQPVQMV